MPRATLPTTCDLGISYTLPLQKAVCNRIATSLKPEVIRTGLQASPGLPRLLSDPFCLSSYPPHAAFRLQHIHLAAP
jgi:hypothetical protein